MSIAVFLNRHERYIRNDSCNKFAPCCVIVACVAVHIFFILSVRWLNLCAPPGGSLDFTGFFPVFLQFVGLTFSICLHSFIQNIKGVL